MLIQFVCNYHCFCKMFSWIFHVKRHYQKSNVTLKRWKIELTCSRWAPKWFPLPRTWGLSSHGCYPACKSLCVNVFFATGTAVCWRTTTPCAFQSDTQSRMNASLVTHLCHWCLWNVEPPKPAGKTSRGGKYGWNFNNYGLAKQGLTGKQWLSATPRKEKQGKSLREGYEHIVMKWTWMYSSWILEVF